MCNEDHVSYTFIFIVFYTSAISHYVLKFLNYLSISYILFFFTLICTKMPTINKVFEFEFEFESIVRVSQSECIRDR